MRWTKCGAWMGIGLVWVAGAVRADAPKPPAAASASRTSKTAQADQLIERADQLAQKGKFSEAAPLIQQAAEVVGDDWALWDMAGWAHLDNNQPETALKAFETARKLSPPGAPLRGGLAVAQFALGRKPELIALLKQMLPAADLAQVQPVMEKGLAAKPGTPDWSYALGYLFLRVAHNSNRAVGPLENAVKLNGNLAGAWLLLIEVNQDLDRGAQEDAAAVKYLELEPETVDAYRLRAQRFAALQHYDEAIGEYNAGIEKHPTAAELYFQLARSYERSAKPKEAEATYNKLLTVAETKKLDDLKAQARAQLANFQARQRNYPEAEKYYREAAQAPGAPAITWETWGSLLALTSHWDEASKALEGAADRLQSQTTAGTPNRDGSFTLRYHAAVCRLAGGMKDQARKDLEAALTSKSASRSAVEVEAAAFLAWLTAKGAREPRLGYQKSDERWAMFTWRQPIAEGESEVRASFSPAATAWRAILQFVQKRYPDCWAQQYALGRIYAAAGYTNEALGLLGSTVKLQPDWWAPYFALGQFYAREKDADHGELILRRVLELAPECRGAKSYLSQLTNLKTDDE